ncbi:MAG: hypothetical protein IJQ12_01620 [Lachnospiraceae bacterium]|nr:hypothetical protein [Lachnospiraceae bacterium]
MTQDADELQKHLAKLIMPQVEALAGEKKISKHAAYYLFLGMYPRDENAFSARELEMLKEAAGVIDVPQREGT